MFIVIEKNLEVSFISFSMDCFSFRKKLIFICFGDYDFY